MTFSELAILATCGFICGVEHSWKRLMHRKAAMLDAARDRFDAAHTETVALIGDLQAVVGEGRAALTAFAAARAVLDEE